MLRALSLCMSMLLCVAGMSGEPPRDDMSDIQEIVARGKLVVCLVVSDHPPFFMTCKDGRLCGEDIDLAKDIAAEMGVEVEFNRKAKTFDGLVDIVSSGEADIAISKLSKTLSRSRKVMFTEPYLVLRKALLVNRLDMAKRRGSMTTEEFIKHFRGTIGVIEGSSYEEFAEKMFPNAEVVPSKDWKAMMRDVYDGKLTAVFRDELEVKRGLKAMPDASLKLQSVVFADTEDPIAMAVSAERPHLCYWLNHYLSAKRVSLTVEELLERRYNCGDAEGVK